jgi:hypothetical protein
MVLDLRLVVLYGSQKTVAVAVYVINWLVAPSPLCDSMLVEIKCINVRRNTTVFLNFLRKQLRVSALFWGGHH